eukprot:1153923-Pelagomonas_calceolata.AAC.1
MLRTFDEQCTAVYVSKYQICPCKAPCSLDFQQCLAIRWRKTQTYTSIRALASLDVINYRIHQDNSQVEKKTRQTT